MAVHFAVRRGGSLLLRALAVGGFATAAWFVCAGVASAGGDHPDEAAKTPDLVNVALGEQPAVTDLLADAVSEHAVPEHVVPHLVADATRRPADADSASASATFDVAGYLGAIEHAVVVDQPFGVEHAPTATVHADSYYSDPYSDLYYSDDESSDYSYSADSPYSGGSYSGGSYSGGSYSAVATNTMPAPLYEAKVAAKAAARAAASAVAVPPPAAVEVVATAPRAAALPFTVEVQTPQPVTTEADSAVVWQVPEPTAPAPSPQQAPGAPTASSSSSGADGGGGHRGGVTASFNGQSRSEPSTAWSTERGDDDRSPGSVQGLPSTSPD